MTTKYRIAEQILLDLNKRSYDSDITIQQIMLKVNQGLAYLARNRYFVSKQTDVEEIDGSLYYRFKSQKVYQDADTLEYYVKLPATTMSFPYGLGIRRVSPTVNPKDEYRAVTNGFNGIYEGLMASRLEGRVGYYQENNILYFVNMTGLNNPETVMMTLVLPLDAIDDDTPLNIPMDMQDEVIRFVVQQYLRTPPKDTSGNNVDQP